MAAVYRHGCSLPPNLSRTAARRRSAVEIARTDAACCVRSPERVSAVSPDSCSILGKRDGPVGKIRENRRQTGQLSHRATCLYWGLAHEFEHGNAVQKSD